MLTKKELVKIISKKAAVIDTSAKELFDLFLRKLAIELLPGETAQFSNEGYFHFRKAKVKKENTSADGNRVEYLDLIIFSPSDQLNIKSAGNLIFSVPEGPGGSQDNLDAHFSLSVGKPVLPNLEGSKSAAYSTDELQEILNRKVESLMIMLHKDESAIADSEILLVDVKSINQDQFELELNEEARAKNSQKSDDAIHSSEQLKSIAWSFGKDLSNQISGDTLSGDDSGINLTEKGKSESSEFENREFENPDSDIEIELDKELKIDETINLSGTKDETVFNKSDDFTADLSESENDFEDISISLSGDKSDRDINQSEIRDAGDISEPDESIEEEIRLIDKQIDDDFNLSDEPELDTIKINEGELDKMFSLPYDKSDEEIDLSDDKIKESIDANVFAESLLKQDDLKDLDIEMNDFEVSDNDEKMGKFERVRSISSSYNELLSIKDINGFDNFIEDRIDIKNRSVTGKNNIDNLKDPDESKKLLGPVKSKGKNEKLSTLTEKKKDLKLNRIESKKVRQNFDRKSLTKRTLLIFTLVAGVVFIIYLLSGNQKSSDVYDEVLLHPTGSENTTYVERTYDIPVNYPYEKSKEDLLIAGLEPPIQATDNKAVQNIVDTKPTVKVLPGKQEAPKVSPNQRPSGTPVQAAYSIFQYGNIFTVQVSAFRSESTAQQVVSKYSKDGYNVFIERSTIDGILWYRVRVGNFDSLEEAKKFRTSQQ